MNEDLKIAVSIAIILVGSALAVFLVAGLPFVLLEKQDCPTFTSGGYPIPESAKDFKPNI